MSERRREQETPLVEPEEAVFQASAIEAPPPEMSEAQGGQDAPAREPSSPQSAPRREVKRSSSQRGPKIADRRELPNLVLASFGFLIWALMLTQCVRLSQARLGALSPDLAQVNYERALLGLDLTAEQLLGAPSSPLIPHLTRGLDSLLGVLPWGGAQMEKLPELLWVLLGLIGVMKGAQLLYERRDLSWLAGGLYTLFVAPLLITPHLATWHVPLITWVRASLVALWSKPNSKRWSLLAGLLIAQGVAASPVYLLFVLYWVSGWVSAGRVKTPDGTRPLKLSERLSSILLTLAGLTAGIAPWVLKGTFVLPPLNYMRASELIMGAMFALERGASEQLTAPWGWMSGLTLLASFTWMSAHISGVSWSRRGVGRGVLTLIHVALSATLAGESSALMGATDAQLVLISPLIWVAVHPWSPIGSFVLLPFSPVLKRVSSLAIFVLLTYTPMRGAYEHVFVEELKAAQSATLTTIERGHVTAELLAIQGWFEQPSSPKERRQLWVWGEEAWPLYELLGGLSPKAPPFLGELSFDDPRLKAVSDDLQEAPVHLIVISKRLAKLTPPMLRKRLQDRYHRVPPPDYAWPEVSALEVYLSKRLRLTPVRAKRTPPRSATATPPQAVRPKLSPTLAPTTPRGATLTPPPMPLIPSASERAPRSEGAEGTALKPLPLPTSGPAVKSPVIEVTDTLPPIPARFAPPQDEEGREGGEEQAQGGATQGEGPRDDEETREGDSEDGPVGGDRREAEAEEDEGEAEAEAEEGEGEAKGGETEGQGSGEE